MSIEFYRPTNRKNQLYRPSVQVTTGPSIEPITLTELKNNLNLSVSDTSHDTKLTLLIQAAREEFEKDTAKCCINRTIEHKQDYWSERIRLTYGPIFSITSVRYYDANNTLQTVSASDYSIDYTNNEIQFVRTYTDPATFDRWDPWVITYVAGYGTLASAVPATFKHAMLLHATNAFENAGDTESYVKAKSSYENMAGKNMRSTYP